MKDSKELLKKLQTGMTTFFESHGPVLKKVCWVFLIYIIMAVIALLLCWSFPSETVNGNVAFFVGVAGTLASMFSIIISARDEIRSQQESFKNEAFLNRLSDKIEFLQSDTMIVKNDLQVLLEGKNNSSLSLDDENEDDTSQNDEQNDWGKADDEVPPG